MGPIASRWTRQVGKTGRLAKVGGLAVKFGKAAGGPLAFAGGFLADMLGGAITRQGEDATGKAKPGAGNLVLRMGGRHFGWTAQGAATGFAFGGPIGAAIGGAIGGGIGLITNIVKETKNIQEMRKTTKNTEAEVAKQYDIQTRTLGKQVELAGKIVSLVGIQRKFALDTLTNQRNAQEIGKRGVAAAENEILIARKGIELQQKRYDEANAAWINSVKNNESLEKRGEKRLILDKAAVALAQQQAAEISGMSGKAEMLTTEQDNMIAKANIFMQQQKLIQGIFEDMQNSPQMITASLINQIRANKTIVEQETQKIASYEKEKKAATTQKDMEFWERKIKDSTILRLQATKEMTSSLNYQRRLWDEIYTTMIMQVPEGSVGMPINVSGYAGMGPAFTPMQGPKTTGGYWTRAGLERDVFGETGGRSGFEQFIGEVVNTLKQPQSLTGVLTLDSSGVGRLSAERTVAGIAEAIRGGT
jgi:hypothetical protein